MSTLRAMTIVERARKDMELVPADTATKVDDWAAS
jgi:hypothetical protein